ncbi:MAG TPA: hypothetical protein VF857_07095 [Spirochaetota bacterium]
MREFPMNGYKRIFSVIVILLLVSISSCAKKGTVSFCEGVDDAGKGINCGKVFTTGDLAVVFTAKEAFGTDALTVKVYNTDDGDRKPELTRTASVDPEKDAGHAEVEFYDEGRFRVVVEKRGELVSEGSVEIIDSINKQ